MSETNIKMVSETCSMCSIFLESSTGTKITETAEFIQTLFVKPNCKLPEELLICDACLAKVQLASSFKTSFLQNSQTHIKQENVENQTLCEICKESVNSNDCIPLFYSVNDMDKLNLFKFLSSELELKSEGSPQTCELCHKFIINFCVVMKSFSVLLPDLISNESLNDVKLEYSNSARNSDVNCVDFTEDFKFDVKKEDLEINEDPLLTNTYEDFLCKNEEIDLKTENESTHTGQEFEIFRCPTNQYSNQIEMLKCQDCDYRTKNKYCLRKHKIVHKNSSEIRMYKCQVCELPTKYKNSLKKHMIIHKNPNEIETFKCQICNYQTKYKYDLKKHRIFHRNSEEIELFSCQVCDYQTNYKGNLKKHIIIHKNSSEIEMFKCQLCDFQTKRKNSLKYHINIHKTFNEIETFKCQICDFTTSQKRYLQRHVNAHKNPNENQMFKCQMCDYETNHKHCFKRHVIVHNKI